MKNKNTEKSSDVKNMKKQFLRIKCYNHKYPHEHVVGWTTEFDGVIKCELCGKVIYDSTLTGVNGTYMEKIYSHPNKGVM